MKYHKQTITDGINGNCWQTAIACLTDLDLDDVPHFVKEYGDQWLHQTRRFIKEIMPSNTLLCIDPYADTLPRQDLEIIKYAIAVGPSPRIKHGLHAVIMDLRTMQLEHDPHPEGNGIPQINWFAYIWRS